jgi:class 3 adenylate cyclase
MDLADWLRGLGLEQYEDAFRDNEIDWRVLPSLTADDLKEIGVVPVGHRRRLLDAIAALGQGEGPRETPPASASGEAERRQLTVMFCDLVGSTPLATRFDPEDLREVIGAYHRCVADTVVRFAGFVAKYMGDGVLIYFGYPEAHEEDAERAVRAGLAIIDAVGRLATPEPLNVRLGVASGLVVVGDLIGAGVAQERGVVGETPNLAAGLQSLAQPGTLVIADSTRRQIGQLFEVEDLGVRALAGFAEPQRAWRIVGDSGVLSRFEALRPKRPRLSGATRSSICYCGAGSRRKPARDGWFWSRARRGLASRASARRYRGASRVIRTYGCAISARRTIRTARSTRSLHSSNAPPGSRPTTRSKRSSANYEHYSCVARETRTR